jgi:hypothetical protein
MKIGGLGPPLANNNHFPLAAAAMVSTETQRRGLTQENSVDLV